MVYFVRTLLLACWAATATAQEAPVTRYTPEQLQQDMRYLQEAIRTIHPNPAHSADLQALARQTAKIEAAMQVPLTRDQVWRELSTLNPLFNDAHWNILQPDREAQMKAHLKAGSGFFPFEVHVEADGTVYIRAALGGAPSPLAGARIDAINGMPIKLISAPLLARSYGDTPAFRAHVLAARWWLYCWKMFGAPEQYDLTLNQNGNTQTLRERAGKTIPALLLEDEQFGSNYQFEVLPNKVALLKVGSFSWPDKKLFYDFTERAFATVRAAGVDTLLIDIRDNRGGDDDMWKEGLLKYIADKPFRNGSDYIKMVIAGRASGNERVGDIVRGQGDTWVAPQPDHPLRFSGKVYVLTGRATYSSAILFSNVMQDFGFGQLVAADGYVNTRTSGGIQGRVLPHSGLEITIPRFILDRPAGQPGSALLRPDIVLADDPFHPRAMVDLLLARLGRR